MGLESLASAFSYYIAQLVSGIKLKSILLTIVTGVEFVLGGWTVAIRALLFLICADFILGMAVALSTHKFSPVKARLGLYKILLYAIAIGVGHNIDLLIFHGEVEFGFRNVIVVFLGVNEALSVIRKLVYFKVPIPKSVVNKLREIEKDIDK